jgi:hypothetical protein
MNWGTCMSGSNNIHFDFPPIMMDGRNYATWQPGAQVSNDIREQADIKTNWQYRKYMMQNADAIIKHNQMAACDQCCACNARCGVTKENVPSTPYVFQSCSDKSQPFGYENSDLKSLYLSKYELQCRMYTPSMTQDQLVMRGYQNYN